MNRGGLEITDSFEYNSQKPLLFSESPTENMRKANSAYNGTDSPDTMRFTEQQNNTPQVRSRISTNKTIKTAPVSSIHEETPFAYEPGSPSNTTFVSRNYQGT